MNEERRQILEMLAQGQIKIDEAERLLAALEKTQPAEQPQRRPKYLRVVVESDEETKVNVRAPMQLLRAGVRLANLIPPQARARVNAAMHEHGVTLDLAQIKPENLEELVDQLEDVTVNVDDGDVKVRVFCE
jgi:SHOCT-like protein